MNDFLSTLSREDPEEVDVEAARHAAKALNSALDRLEQALSPAARKLNEQGLSLEDVDAMEAELALMKGREDALEQVVEAVSEDLDAVISEVRTAVNVAAPDLAPLADRADRTIQKRPQVD